MKEIDIQVQEAQRIPNKLGPKRATPKYIIFNLLNIKDKERIFILREFLKDFIYLFLERGEGRETKREGIETSTCGCLSPAPYWGPGPQPSHVT